MTGKRGGDRDPKGNSLWLLPSGPDQVGEAFARDLRSDICGFVVADASRALLFRGHDRRRP
jgi:hypothetical protein